jgi:hypothetical protein
LEKKKRVKVSDRFVSDIMGICAAFSVCVNTVLKVFIDFNPVLRVLYRSFHNVNLSNGHWVLQTNIQKCIRTKRINGTHNRQTLAAIPYVSFLMLLNGFLSNFVYGCLQHKLY